MKLIPFDATHKIYRPLLLLDYRTVIYGLINTYADSDAIAAWKYYLESICCELSPRNLVICDDSSPYWRQAYIEEHAPNLPKYKANRKPKPENFYHWVDSGYKAAELLGISVLKFEGMEADDIIAAFCRVYQNVVICSTDNDLMQLISDIRETYMFLTGSFTCNSKLRDETEVRHWYASKTKRLILNMSEIIDYKMIHGDRGDNLIGGTPRELIDLNFNPIAKDLDNKLKEVKLLTFTQSRTQRLAYALELS